MRANYEAAKFKVMAALDEDENRSRSSSNSSGIVIPDYWALILEDMIVTFLVTLIPKLILLGRPPVSIVEIYVPLLSALLMALYSYMRARGIEPREEEG